MIPVAVSQRVSIIAEYGERRDALDQQWSVLLHAAGLLPILLPNQLAVARAIVARTQPAGLLLTGGNDLSAYGGDAPERDETELGLLDDALRTGQPVLGVCRGMQVIQHAFKVPLERVSGHVAREQIIEIDGQRRQVNSYHNWGTRETATALEVWARADDGVVKAVRHRDAQVTGFMWHPERMSPFRSWDLAFMRAFFRG